MTDSPPTIPTPATGRGLRLPGFAALTLLLAATGCLRRGPPPLEEVIVGEWAEASLYYGERFRGTWEVIDFQQDGTWKSFRRNDSPVREDTGDYGAYVLGPGCVLRRFYNQPLVVVEYYGAKGLLSWIDDDTGAAWLKEDHKSARRSKAAAMAKRYDAVTQSKMASRIAGEWMSLPSHWYLKLGDDLKWSSTNWTYFEWDKRVPRGFFVMANDHEVLLQREGAYRGSYLLLQDEHLVHWGWDNPTNIFHRLPASAPPPGK